MVGTLAAVVALWGVWTCRSGNTRSAPVCRVAELVASATWPRHCSSTRHDSRLRDAPQAHATDPRRASRSRFGDQSDRLYLPPATPDQPGVRGVRARTQHE